VTVCPAELRQELGARPTPPADAVIKHNDAGGQFLDALIAWGDHAAGLFTDAKASCAKATSQGTPPSQ
jgi:hypothetical protein